jgi:hypothetical protein
LLQGVAERLSPHDEGKRCARYCSDCPRQDTDSVCLPRSSPREPDDLSGRVSSSNGQTAQRRSRARA